ncbi:hypothetical protein DHEL01_v202048 [Diaporthe helianthi]|uniref:Zn(2)-C6 fungal-type domain-containing protein n=1 Tax=Diaporthe helianthi TaxID=158607 RepID=A0A2P5IAL1_DIAHE|nr:hypothetical protein DHEL01_v202048 [Diaporthe helianthi]
MGSIDMTVESKACLTCARAKRKCERQIPACRRCQSRGMRCEYPTVTSSCDAPARPQIRQQHATVSDDPLSQLLFGLSEDMMMPTDGLLSHHHHHYNNNLDTVIGDTSSIQPLASLPWYLEEASWDVDHMVSAHSTAPYCSAVLRTYTDNVNEWLTRWVETGSCPFIHERTYKHHTPRCVQDAYTALSTYQNRKESNKPIITSLLEQRMKQLLADQPLPPPGTTTTSTNDEDAGSAALNTFEHLARVHALLIYQIICLYDGDIRLRHVAETQIPTLNSWLRQLVSSAQRTAAQGPETFISPMVTPPDSHQESISHSLEQIGGQNNGDQEWMSLASALALSPEDTAWYAWLFAETIRRTWLIATAMQSVYLTLQVLWAPCPGGLPITTRKGAFEASSSFAWSACCEGHRKGVDFARRHEDRLFEECRPEDLDEFTVRLLEINYGAEKVERWKYGR